MGTTAKHVFHSKGAVQTISDGPSSSDFRFTERRRVLDWLQRVFSRVTLNISQLSISEIASCGRSSPFALLS